jgi:predicted NAD-dependent protein-ADP-ribosyltransferase YbiA (DUF1768 family)
LVVDGKRYWSVVHYYFCEKYNWRDAFPNDDTKRYYELLRNCDAEETTVMLGRRLPRLRRKFKTLVNARKPELGTVDNALKLDARCIPDWKTAKHEVMLRALRVRLSKPEIRQALHKTHRAELIYRPRLILLRIPPSITWGTPGANNYGRMLMSLRREITCESDGVPVSIESKFPTAIDWNGVEHDVARRKRH